MLADEQAYQGPCSCHKPEGHCFHHHVSVCGPSVHPPALLVVFFLVLGWRSVWTSFLARIFSGLRWSGYPALEGELMGYRSTPSPRTNGVSVPRLAAVRKRAGLSQRALAGLAGVSEQTISRLERGAHARYTTLALLARALQVPPTRLLRRPHRKRPAPTPHGVSGEQE